jgi:N-acetylmuramoyl-L-alanine amidase
MKLKVIIDAGHGGKDSGAVGAFSKEKDLNLEYSKKLYDVLKADTKFEPILTRSDDRYLKLSERAQIAIDKKAHVFLSIHCNASVSREPHDCQMYYYNAKKDKPLATALFKMVDKLDGMTSKWSKEIFGNFYVLRKLKDTNIPACLIEIAFISNAEDEIRLNNQEFQDNFCQEAAKGLRAFILMS